MSLLLLRALKSLFSCRIGILVGLASALEISGCGLLRMNLSRSVSRWEDIPYAGNVPDPRRSLDIFCPIVPVKGGAPVVLFVHGGYWKNQDKQYYRPFTGLYSSVGMALAEKDIVGVIINYRLSPDVGIEDQLQDLAEALKWTGSHIHRYGGNPARIYLAGHSAGGHLVTLFAAREQSSDQKAVPPVQGVIALSPILDLVHMEQSNDGVFNRDTTYRVFGRDPHVLVRYSPITYLSSSSPPLLILTASEDYAYIREQTALSIPFLRGKGVRFQFKELHGLDHSGMVMSIGKKGDEVTPLVVAFIRNGLNPEGGSLP